VDDGVLNPDTARIAPGSIIAVARNAGHPSGPSLAPLERSGDPNLSQVEHERLYTAINDQLLNNALPQMEGAVRSPTEFVKRWQELQSDLGAAFGRLHTEAMVPIIQRSLDIMLRKGLLAGIPAGTDRIKIGNGLINLQVLAPIAQQQNLEDVQGVTQTLEVCGALVGKDLSMLAFKVEEIPEWIGKKLGMPSELIRGKLEKQQMIQAVATMMAAMQAQGQGNMGQMLASVGQPEQPQVGAVQ
jgi:hypothetical protein